MVPERPVPDSPLEFIKRRLNDRKIWWTYHVNMRLRTRSISRQTILESVASFEIIEEYPEDKYFPSYLIYARDRNSVFHVLIAVDVVGDNVRVVTAYWPSPEEWEQDLRKRRTV
jgi:hypothetical protein